LVLVSARLDTVDVRPGTLTVFPRPEMVDVLVCVTLLVIVRATPVIVLWTTLPGADTVAVLATVASRPGILTVLALPPIVVTLDEVITLLIVPAGLWTVDVRATVTV